MFYRIPDLAGFCECGDDRLGSINEVEFLEQLFEYCLLRKYFALSDSLLGSLLRSEILPLTTQCKNPGASYRRDNNSVSFQPSKPFDMAYLQNLRDSKDCSSFC
jgi:hypothetical protein